MTTYAGPTIEIALRRVREQGGIPTSFDFAMSLLSLVQRTFNAGLRRTLVTASFPTYAYQHVYAYRTVYPDAIDITNVKLPPQTLENCTFDELSAYSPTWFRDTSTEIEFWSQVGRELLILTPALTTDSSVTIVYTKETSELDSYSADYNDALELPDTDIEDIIASLEVLLLTSSRRLPEAKLRLTQLAERLGKFLGVAE